MAIKDFVVQNLKLTEESKHCINSLRVIVEDIEDFGRSVYCPCWSDIIANKEVFKSLFEYEINPRYLYEQHNRGCLICQIIFGIDVTYICPCESKLLTITDILKPLRGILNNTYNKKEESKYVEERNNFSVD
ncbi:MAG: hypothetical protein ACTSQA_00540 [Candidatus Heimdallarchaeaceae archaeon]